MLTQYIDHFTTGEIRFHKDGSRYWIKDKGPVIESYIGWVEHYVDPEKQRAVWEGWVAAVDKKRSERLKKLVARAETILSKMPWAKELEKDQFHPPDFTSLDVLAFASDRLPKGINIPNYNDIRE
jgi:dipeptidyl-peptidase-3